MSQCRGSGVGRGGRGHGEAEVGRHCSTFANMICRASNNISAVDNKHGRGGRVEVTECKGWVSGMEEKIPFVNTANLQ